MADDGSHALVRRAHALERPVQASRSTRTVGFDGVVLTWDDLPAQTRKAAAYKGPVVAEHAGTDDDSYRGRDGLMEAMRAWRAHRERIYVAVAERLVGGRDTGPWRPVSLHRIDVDGPARRRIGWLPAGVPAQSGLLSTGPLAGEPTAPSAPPHQGAAARVWPFLPAAVRDGIVRAVPVPDDWLGGLVQQSRGDGMPVSQEIVVLRRDARTAVVVRATREVEPRAGSTAQEQEAALAGADWLVEQVTFSVHERARLAQARAGSRLPWA